MISWPQDDVQKDSASLTFISEIAPHEEKVFLVKLYLPPAYSFNEYSLSFSWTPDTSGKIPVFGESSETAEPAISDVHITTGKNVAFLVDEDTQNNKYVVKGLVKRILEINFRLVITGVASSSYFISYLKSLEYLFFLSFTVNPVQAHIS